MYAAHSSFGLLVATFLSSAALLGATGCGGKTDSDQASNGKPVDTEVTPETGELFLRNTNGTLDGTFTGGANAAVYAIAVQGIDGKIVIGGAFDSIGGVTRNHIARLDASGALDLKTKEGAGGAPAGFVPWFEVPGRRSEGVPVAFGHWSTLGLVMRPDLLALDTGCVWGGCLSAVRVDGGRQELVQVTCAQAQRPGERVLARLRDLLDTGDFLENALRLLEHALAERRHRDLGLAALEQRPAQFFLELLDRHRQRRLADEALRRGPAEIAFLADGDDVAQFVQRHGEGPPRVASQRANAAPVSGCLRPKSTVASR